MPSPVIQSPIQTRRSDFNPIRSPWRIQKKLYNGWPRGYTDLRIDRGWVFVRWSTRWCVYGTTQVHLSNRVLQKINNPGCPTLRDQGRHQNIQQPQETRSLQLEPRRERGLLQTGSYSVYLGVPATGLPIDGLAWLLNQEVSEQGVWWRPWL